MANNENQRTMGLAISGSDRAKVERYIKASGLSVSRFLHKAVLAYITTLPDPEVPTVPLVKPLPHGEEPTHFFQATEEEMRRIGATRADFAAYDMDGQDKLLLQLRWLRGYGALGGIMPCARYDGDMAYLAWLEDHCLRTDRPKGVATARRIRAHLLNLPDPPPRGPTT